jgi:hypothetical protein
VPCNSLSAMLECTQDEDLGRRVLAALDGLTKPTHFKFKV